MSYSSCPNGRQPSEATTKNSELADTFAVIVKQRKWQQGAEVAAGGVSSDETIATVDRGYFKQLAGALMEWKKYSKNGTKTKT